MSAKTLSEHPKFVGWWFDLLRDISNDSDKQRHQKRIIAEFRSFAQEYETSLLFRDDHLSKRFYISVIRQQQVWSLELIRLCYFRQPLPIVYYLDLCWQYDPLTSSLLFDSDEVRMIKILAFARDHRLCTLGGGSEELPILFRQPVFPSHLIDLFKTVARPEFPSKCYYGAVQTLDLKRINYLEKLKIEYPPHLLDHLFTKDMFQRFRQFEEDDHRLIEEVATDHPAKVALRLADELTRRKKCNPPQDAILLAVKSHYLTIIPEFTERKYPFRRDVFYRKLFVVLRENPSLDIDLSDERWKELLGGERSKRYQYAARLKRI